MGSKLSEHPGKFLAGGWLWYIGGLLLLAAVFGAFNGVREIANGEATIVEVISAVFFSGLFGCLLLIVPVLRWRQRVVVYEQGVVWERLYGPKAIPRASIRGVALIIHRGRSGNYDEIEIFTGDGTVTVKGVADSEQLANHIRAWTSGAAPSTSPAQPPGQAPGGWTPPNQAPPNQAPPNQNPPNQGGGWRPPGS